MKKSLFLVVALLAVASALCAAPAVQTDAQTLAAGIFAPAEQPIFMTSCSESLNCYCGGMLMATLTCTGTVCSSGPGTITCDGHRYSCKGIDCNPPGPE
jgi:hypothetical protein